MFLVFNFNFYFLAFLKVIFLYSYSYFWGQIWAKGAKIRPETRFFPIFSSWVHYFSLMLHKISYKYCIIISGSNTKLLETYRLLNKSLLSLTVLSSYSDLHFLHHLQWQSFFQFLDSYSENFKCHK